MTKKVLKWAAAVFGAIAVLLAAFLAYVQVTGIPTYPHATPVRHVEVTPERVAAGRLLAMTLCTGCHLDPSTKRLTGKRLEDIPPAFGEIHSANITRSTAHGIGAWSDGQLAYLLRTGLRPDGRYVPPYMVKLPHLSDEELDGLIAFLRSDDDLVSPVDTPPKGVSTPSLLVKVLSRVVMKPLPFPAERIVAPARSDRVAYGRYLVTTRDCYACHSADFKSTDPLEPEKTPGYFGGGNTLIGGDGNAIFSANLTPDPATGLGRWSEADFSRAVRFGVSRNATVLRYPMEPKPEIDEDQTAAMYAYLRTIPAIENRVARFKNDAPAGDEGARTYHAYGCASCHGETGVAFGDLRGANRDFASDGPLLEWLLDAPRLRPGTKMPGFRGIIAERDYAPLIRHVRKLSSNAATGQSARL
jgi:cytochrome c2